eukprot:480884_1
MSQDVSTKKYRWKGAVPNTYIVYEKQNSFTFIIITINHRKYYFWSYISCIGSPWTETIKSGEHEYWTRKCPLAELSDTKSISIQVEVHIFAIKWKKDISQNNSINYAFKSFTPITKTIFPFTQRFAYKLDRNTMDIFRNCAQGKCMCSEIINNMWVITLYPRGNQSVSGYQSYTAVYLRLVVWPNNIQTLKAKFKLTCVEKNDSVEYDHIFNSDASSYGTHAWDEWIDLKDLKTLTFQVEINICSVENVEDVYGVDSKWWYFYSMWMIIKN